MAEQKQFLASELAAELALPRTTINDWLTRFGSYLEVETRGKRKVYSEKSLKVLREIAGLRDAGQSAFEIEAELARRYGLRPEVTQPPAPETEPPAEVPATAAPQSEAGALMRPDTLEFEKLLGAFREQDVIRQQAVRRFWRLFLVAAILLLLALAIPVMVIGGYLLKEAEKERQANETLVGSIRSGNEALNGELAAARKAIDELQARQQAERDAAANAAKEIETRRATEDQARQAELKRLTAALEQMRGDYAANIAKLTTELETQRKAAATERTESAKAEAARRETELARLRDEFARDRRELLEKLEKLSIKPAPALPLTPAPKTNEEPQKEKEAAL